MRLVCVVEVSCTFPCELQMLALVLSNWNVSGPITMSNFHSSDGYTITYELGYLLLVKPGMRIAQASIWPCCLYPLRLHLQIVRACSMYNQ